MKIIKTKRLILRDLEEADWQAVHEYASDPEVVRYMDWGPNTEDETTEFIRRAIASQKERPRRNFTLAIVLKSENSPSEAADSMHQTQTIERDGLAIVSTAISGDRATRLKLRERFWISVSTS
jgi:RimJ/RimL family protein N-acetyltransferase